MYSVLYRTYDGVYDLLWRLTKVTLCMNIPRGLVFMRGILLGILISLLGIKPVNSFCQRANVIRLSYRS